MCNLYNLTTTREAIIELSRATRSLAGWNKPYRDPVAAAQRSESTERKVRRRLTEKSDKPTAQFSYPTG